MIKDLILKIDFRFNSNKSGRTNYMFITFYFFDLGFKSDNGKITSLILNFLILKVWVNLKKKKVYLDKIAANMIMLTYYML